MAYGLRIFDTSGNVTLDTSDGVMTILGIKTYTLSGTFYSGSFTDSNLTKGTPFYFISTVPYEGTYGTSLTCHITFSGTTCSWTVDPSSYSMGVPDQYGTLTFYYGYF